jgi:hypothetical protein
MSDFFVKGSKVSTGKAAANADQLEADAILNGTVSLSGCLTDDTIAFDNLAEEYDAATNPVGNAGWAEDDGARETAIADTIVEIERRRTLLGALYPFELSGNTHSFSYVPAQSLSGVYEFCLAFAVTQHKLKANPACRAVREFERLVGRLLKAFLHSESAEFYRSGAPPDGDRPTTIPGMLNDLHVKTNGEWEFSPRVGGAAQSPQGDDGIDVIVWKRFGDTDRRLGKPFFLVQCACGDDWYGKRRDLDPVGFETKWSGRISFARALSRCLATPRHVPHEAVWLEGTSDGGILLDRVRLSWMAETCLTEGDRTSCKARLTQHTASLNKRPEV